MPRIVKFISDTETIEVGFAAAAKLSKLVETLGAVTTDEEDVLEVPLCPTGVIVSSHTLASIREYMLEYGEGSKAPTNFPQPLSAEIETFANPFEKEFLLKQLGGDGLNPTDNLNLLVLYKTAQFLKMTNNLAKLLAGWIASRIMEITNRHRLAWDAAEKIRELLHMNNDWLPDDADRLATEREWPEDDE